jgi:sugar (pentulose or hexulose) kinase
MAIGIDGGTSGVRAMAATAEGEVVAEARAPLVDLPTPAPAHEQDAHTWWRAVCQTLGELRESLKSGQNWNAITGIAVTSTSGSLVLADSDGEPVRPAMLYDDGRAAPVADELNARLPAGEAKVNASFSLSKSLWVRKHEPAVWDRARYILHPADWLTAKLTGEWGFSDYSDALKLGYDQEKNHWSAAVALADVPSAMLPSVVAPGEQVGAVCARAASDTGLTAGVPVLAGATDGLASLIGSGAHQPGHANTTLGTTLVWKVLSPAKPRLGPGMYCHYLPSKLWAPGAASNTGPGSIQLDEARIDPAETDRRAATHLPTPIQCYPLSGRGERFPFLNPQARAFWEGTPASPGERHAAQLQALACVERWGYERLEDCGVAVSSEVFSAGSAAASPVLSQLRANVLDRAVVRCANPTAAFGAAILAAGTTLFGGDLTAAIRSMTRVDDTHAPEPARVEAFDTAYQHFRAACSRHGLESL